MISPYVLQVEKVSHAFDKEFVLREISFSVEEGAIVCVLGPSGCGKTTLLRIIAGLIAPSSGLVRIAGQDQSLVPTHRRNIGFVFQTPALFPHLTVFENVAFPFKRGGRKVEGDWRAAVAKMLHATGLQPHEHRSVATLSGGQFQRVALARALVYRPSLLILDEPLGSLDNVLKAQLFELMLKLHEEFHTTFLYVTHDEREALRIASKVAVIDDEHELRQYGDVDEVLANPRTRSVAEILGGWNFLRATVEAGPPQVFKFESGATINCNMPGLGNGVQVDIGLPVRTIRIVPQTTPSGAEDISFPVTISRSAPWYEGWLYQCTLVDDQQTHLTCCTESRGAFARGSAATVRFKREDMHVFKDF